LPSETPEVASSPTLKHARILVKLTLLDAPPKSLIITLKENVMSDNPTQEMPNSSSFEERVFARFDALDTHVSSLEINTDRRLSSLEEKVDGLDRRLTSLEEKVDTRLRETRPIWEAVQADLAKVKDNVKEIKYVLKAIHKDMFRARGEHEELDERVDELNERVEKLESPSTR
jgi:polyhydroxyalkanoate synthesis regulator phasin